MDRRTSSPQTTAAGDFATESGSGARSCASTETTPGSPLKVGALLVRTIRHFFPELNDWMDAIPDPRFRPFVVYHKRFLLWWELSLFLFQLSSRRQLDFELAARGTQRPGQPQSPGRHAARDATGAQDLELLPGRHRRSRWPSYARTWCGACSRMRVLDAGRLQGYWVVAIDGTGYLVFRQRHCPHCLEWRYGEVTLYLHQVLEAKLLGPEGLVVSLGTVFIDQSDLADTPADADAEKRKQDCELKAFNRLDAQFGAPIPQLPICYSGDSLFGCGRAWPLDTSPVVASCTSSSRVACPTSGKTCKACCRCAPTNGWNG